MTGIAFHMACVPPKTSHHHKRIVKMGKFSRLADKPELVAARQMLESLLLPHQPAAPIVGPVALWISFEWPWLKSHGPKLKAQGRIRHTSKPDLTNVAKTIEDRLVALRFIEDDSTVVELHLMKWWGETPGIEVRIDPLGALPDQPDQLGSKMRMARASLLDEPTQAPRPSLADA